MRRGTVDLMIFQSEDTTRRKVKKHTVFVSGNSQDERSLVVSQKRKKWCEGHSCAVWDFLPTQTFHLLRHWIKNIKSDSLNSSSLKFKLKGSWTKIYFG